MKVNETDEFSFLIRNRCPSVKLPKISDASKISLYENVMFDLSLLLKMFFKNS